MKINTWDFKRKEKKNIQFIICLILEKEKKKTSFYWVNKKKVVYFLFYNYESPNY
jgi:hypothetical protein